MPTGIRSAIAFWSAATLTLLACATVLRHWNGDAVRGMPAKPALPFLGDAYVSNYGGASADHWLYRFGLGEFGRRLRESDVLVLGSSHAQLGLSAAQLTGSLTQQRGQAVRAYNASLGHAEGIAFFRDIVERNDLRDKTLVVDAWHWRGERVSEIGETVRRAGTLDAALQVGSLWIRHACHWLADGWLPRISFPHGRILARRALDWHTLRSRASGDVLDWWSPDRGSVYQVPGHAAGVVGPPGPGPHAPPDFSGPFARTFPRELLEQRRLDAVLTLVPYPHADAGWLAAQAGALGLPFIAIDATALEFTGDRHHLNAAGRAHATERLAKQFRGAQRPP